MGISADRRGLEWDATGEAGRWLVDELNKGDATVGAAVPSRYSVCLEIPRTRVLYPALVEPTEAGVVRSDVIAQVLGSFTGSQICHFALWEGWDFLGREFAELHPRRTVGSGRPELLQLPNRLNYYLWSGPLHDIGAFAREGCDPSFVWPDDRRWFLGSFVDSTATYVGTDNFVAEAVLGAALDARIVDRSAEQAFPRKASS